MKSAEEWVFDYYVKHTVNDDKAPDGARTTPPHESWIKLIQSDTLCEAAEIAALYTDADFDCAAKLIFDAILARAKELDQ